MRRRGACATTIPNSPPPPLPHPFPIFFLPPFLLLAFLTSFNEGCELRIKVQSLTATPFQFKMSIPEKGIGTEQALFEGQGQKEVTLKGENCGEKPWKLTTLKRGGPEGRDWVPAKETIAKLDGNGDMEIKVHDDLQPWVGARMGILCAESFFCGG